MVKTTKQQRLKKWAASILAANIQPLEKVRKLVAIGYDEDEAEHMVGSQLGSEQMVYYEQLPSPEYARKEDG